MPYPDGHSPPDDVLNQWLDLVHERFFEHPTANNPTIAAHCVAGLGRAPVLVAIALIEFAGMDPVEAVVMIRKYRRGAINDRGGIEEEQLDAALLCDLGNLESDCSRSRMVLESLSLSIR